MFQYGTGDVLRGLVTMTYAVSDSNSADSNSNLHPRAFGPHQYWMTMMIKSDKGW